MAATKSLLHVVYGLVVALSIYPMFICLLTIPTIQQQVVYLNAFKMTWAKDLSVPEEFGFMRRQVMPFWLTTPDGERLLAWHILPLHFYLKNEAELQQESPGITEDITKTLGSQLLKQNPNTKLVVYFHGAAGTLGSGYRPSSYHAISAASPEDLHIIAIDYRGFGMSSGRPSESGLLIDAVCVINFALEVLELSSKQIVLFGQSLGTAVSIAAAEHFAAQDSPVLFSGLVLVAPYVNVETLTATYRIAGIIPILDPLARFPTIMRFLNTFITDKWASNDKIKSFIHKVQSLDNGRFQISLIHGKDDYDIPFKHSEILFEHATNATAGMNERTQREWPEWQNSESVPDAAGYRLLQTSKHGSISLNILGFGLHDKIMGYPIVSRAIQRSFP
ncbi:MAG: hypothetical protein GOMPHAMPRED_001993 [Gomphillus americanus]|uniref:AB hydrolase-1 domain-containing protein n=1 Tax=Gomphillus americanus TaxID=1940652 RepID=A0A8H3IGP5_9LECA|nr:MAG: hypothetical protein GOMPHAMPRED_001993 [Gomphillus americanus]